MTTEEQGDDAGNATATGKLTVLGGILGGVLGSRRGRAGTVVGGLLGGAAGYLVGSSFGASSDAATADDGPVVITIDGDDAEVASGS